jgi:hypothetical protein
VSLYLQLLVNILKNPTGTVEIFIDGSVPNINYGTRQIFTSRLALVASIAIKPASLPISLTNPIP